MSNIFTANDKAQRDEILARVTAGDATPEDFKTLMELNEKFSYLKKNRALDLETIKEQIHAHAFTLEEFFTAGIFERPAPVTVEVEGKTRKPRTPSDKPAPDESKLCFTIKPEGKGRPYKIYSTDATEPLPQFVPTGLKRFYDANPDTFKTRLAEHDELTPHGIEFFGTAEGVAYIEKLEKFAKEGKLAPQPKKK